MDKILPARHKKQASDADARATKLVELREKYLDQIKSDLSRISAIVSLIFRNPFISVPVVMRATGVSDQGARNLLAKAEGLGWITKAGKRGRGGRTLWASR